MNSIFVQKVIKIVDIGGTMYLHVFGSAFGLALSYIHSNKRNWKDNPNIKGTYSTTLYSFLGTLFIWILFPSYNSLFVQNQ